jgi:VIT1/CCC1 family predicted Fe2+/Mn2+ transporter
MLPPFLFSKQHRSDEEVAEWEAAQAKLSRGYYASPWLSALVTFTGFVAAFIGSFTLLLMIANLRHGTVWVPYAVILAALASGHLCLRSARYLVQRRAKRRSAPGPADSGRPSMRYR